MSCHVQIHNKLDTLWRSLPKLQRCASEPNVTSCHSQENDEIDRGDFMDASPNPNTEKFFFPSASKCANVANWLVQESANLCDHVLFRSRSFCHHSSALSVTLSLLLTSLWLSQIEWVVSSVGIEIASVQGGATIGEWSIDHLFETVGIEHTIRGYVLLWKFKSLLHLTKRTRNTLFQY